MAELLGLLPTDPGEAGIFIWQASLVLGLVVAAVVTLLLWLIHRTAGSINGAVSMISNTAGLKTEVEELRESCAW